MLWQPPTPQPPQSKMPVLITAYQPGLGGINCNNDCSTVAIGLRTGDHLNGRAMACPTEWLGTRHPSGRWYTSVIYFPESAGLSPRFCIDSFGSPTDRKPTLIESEWVIRLDLYESNPFAFPQNHWNIDGWVRRWEPVPLDWQ